MPFIHRFRFFTVMALGLAFTQPLLSQINTQADPRKIKMEKRNARREKINQMVKAEEEGAIVYDKQQVYGGKLFTDGWSVFFEGGKRKSPVSGSWYLVELGERKANNEDKAADALNAAIFLGRPLVYGKQNMFFHTKFGFGKQHLIGNKANKNGVAVMALYGGGLSLGLLKPYYIDKLDGRSGQYVTIAWQGDKSRNDSLFLDTGTPSNGAGLWKGIKETKIRPGVFAKAALRFDYGRFNEMVSAVECGFNVEFYPKEIAIMVNNPTRRFFANLYVGIEFGRRH